MVSILQDMAQHAIDVLPADYALAANGTEY